ncbi:MAG: hypothetical protein J1F12_01045 [Muribaculaceae bacterium]|nr:hypothetical protein [Muribaculaceae bacterium]
MRGLGILILIVVFFWLIWPVISRWLKRKAMERAEDYMRKSMGMPPRDKKRKDSKSSDNTYSGENFYQRRRRNPFGPDRYTKEPIIPKEYAEDVEFTETKDFSASESRKDQASTQTYHESQISDVEWTEIKKPRNK